MVGQITKMQERIAAAKTAATDRDEGKETSLGTSKINYIGERAAERLLSFDRG